MIAAQGGDPDAELPVAREQHVVTASSSGILTTLDAYAVGLAAWRLGAGRARKEDPVQAGAGVEIHAKPGDLVTAGQPLLTLHTDTPEKFPLRPGGPGRRRPASAPRTPPSRPPGGAGTHRLTWGPRPDAAAPRGRRRRHGGPVRAT